MNEQQRRQSYYTLTRWTGVALVLLCVMFQRREIMGLGELLFVGLSVGIQELYLRSTRMRPLRMPLLVAYSFLPLALIAYEFERIAPYRGDVVKMLMFTPMPLVLVSVQIMVLYLRESARLMSVVLVLCTFSVVVGIRRPLTDPIWPWLAAIGALACVWMCLSVAGTSYWRWKSRLIRTHSAPRPSRPGHVLRASLAPMVGALSLSVLMLTLVLYFGMPRLDFGDDPNANGGTTDSTLPPRTGGGRSGGGGSGGRSTGLVSGLSNQVTLGDFSVIKRSFESALTLRAQDDFAPSVVYVRVHTMVDFDGQVWSAFPEPDQNWQRIPEGATRRLNVSPELLHLSRPLHRWEIEIDQEGIGTNKELPMVSDPIEVDSFEGDLWYDPVTQTVKSPTIEAGDAWIVSSRMNPNPRFLSRRMGGKISRPTDLRYIDVPDELRTAIANRCNRYQYLSELAALKHNNTPMGRQGSYFTALAIVKMFREKLANGEPAWEYSLNKRPKVAWDSVARFLDTTSKGERVGHCEYFATGMCVLLRCLGIPCRVAVGFAAVSPTNGVYDVSAANAHAWTEVWFPQVGWVSFDPTPPVGVVPETAPTETDPETDPATDPETLDPEISGGTDGAGPTDPDTAEDPISGFDRKTQTEFYANIQDTVAGLVSGLNTGVDGLTKWMPGGDGTLPAWLRLLLLLSPVGLSLAIITFWKRRKSRMERRVLGTSRQREHRAAQGLYVQLLLLLVKFGFRKRPSETPREFAQRVLDRAGDAHRSLLELTEVYYRLRYNDQEAAGREFREKLLVYESSLKRLRSGPQDSSSSAG